MRFLANENVEAAIVEALRRAGHDVLEVGRIDPGIDDEAVVRFADREGRILITNDKDFGGILFLQGKRIPGVLLLRLPGRRGGAKVAHVLAAVGRADLRLRGRFSVVEPGRVRSRRLR